MCVYWCRPSPKSYQNLGLQVYDMYLFCGVDLYLFNCLIFTLYHSFICICFFFPNISPGAKKHP